MPTQNIVDYTNNLLWEFSPKLDYNNYVDVIGEILSQLSWLAERNTGIEGLKSAVGQTGLYEEVAKVARESGLDEKEQADLAKIINNFVSDIYDMSNKIKFTDFIEDSENPLKRMSYFSDQVEGKNSKIRHSK